MNENINLIAFGTFGNPNGFRQTFFIGNKGLSESIKTFDLNTNAIKLFPDTKIYAIRKENINGIVSISYSIYNYAKEQNSDRSGTFIGSSILFTNEIAEESLSISILADFNENLLIRNVENDVIQVAHSEELSVSKPKDFDKAFFHLKGVSDINFIDFYNKSLVVYTDVKLENLRTLYANSLDLLNVYDSIYFTDSRSVAEFVHQKGMFKLVEIAGFEAEIEKRATEVIKNRALAIANFEDERRRLDVDIKTILNELNDQLQLDRRKHSNNEASILKSEKNIKLVETYYSKFNEYIEVSVAQIGGGGNVAQIRELYRTNKRIFVNSVNELRKPSFVAEIKELKPALKTDDHEGKSSQRLTFPNVESISNDAVRNEKSNKIFKILTGLFAFLWVASLLYILLPRENKNQPEPIDSSASTASSPLPVEQTDETITLSPAPNSQLNSRELRLINREGKRGMTDVELVKLIFRNNPNEIERFYKGKEDAYLNVIRERNNSCFENNIWIKDSLTFIPSYKSADL